MPRLSVITPVYNAETFLERCLRSVLGSTVTDIEHLCVDDGSSDASLALLRSWAERDERVKVFSQPNAGASAARNTALGYASGDFIIFVDADDEVEPDYFEQCLNAAVKYSAECVVTGWSVITDAPGIVPPPCQYVDVERFAQMFGVYRPATPGDLAGMQPGVSGHMYAREVLKRSGALFPSSIRYGEDTAFHYAQYPCCTAYVQLPLTGYIVHRVAGSSSSSSSESVVDMIEATDWLRIHYERLGWPGGTAESLLRYASHAWRRVCSMAPHGKVLASANRLRSVLQSVPGGELALASLRSRDARSLASVLAGGRGLSFSYYWKRLCKGVGLLKR